MAAPSDPADSLARHAPPRRTAYALPPYRYLPGGRQPHPTADPRGHSHDRPPPYPETALDPADWPSCLAYLYGCDLYNRGYWWEAHEAWEAPWRLAAPDRPEHAALKGLIQLANGHLKLHIGRIAVLPRLQRRYASHFAQVRAQVAMPFLGLDFGAVQRAADTYFADLASRPAPVHDPLDYPYLLLLDDPEPAP